MSYHPLWRAWACRDSGVTSSFSRTDCREVQLFHAAPNIMAISLRETLEVAGASAPLSPSPGVNEQGTDGKRRVRGSLPLPLPPSPALPLAIAMMLPFSFALHLPSALTRLEAPGAAQIYLHDTERPICPPACRLGTHYQVPIFAKKSHAVDPRPCQPAVPLALESLPVLPSTHALCEPVAMSSDKHTLVFESSVWCTWRVHTRHRPAILAGARGKQV